MFKCSNVQMKDLFNFSIFNCIELFEPFLTLNLLNAIPAQ